VCISWTMKSLISLFRFLLVFFNPYRQMSGYCLRFGQGCFLPHPSLFIIQESKYNSTLYSELPTAVLHKSQKSAKLYLQDLPVSVCTKRVALAEQWQTVAFTAVIEGKETGENFVFKETSPLHV
jgi:hypothetical protein